MRNKIQQLIVAVAVVVAMFQLESCSSYRTVASMPDGHNRYHPDFAMHVLKKHNSNYYNNHGNNAAKVLAGNTAKPAPTAPVQLDNKNSDAVASMTASANNEVPTLKNPKDIYKILTEDEREQARQAVDKIFAKRPVLKQLVDGRLNKLNEKYPAAKESSFKKADGGGALSLGEILAIVAIACSVTFFLGLAGLIIGIIALQQIRNNGGATWAKILAILAIVFGVLDLLGLLILILIAIAHL